MKQTNEIQGWFDYANFFKFLLDTIADDGVFVEGGAWLGKSSSFLCDYARDRINIFIVDTWKGSADELMNVKIAAEKDLYRIFLENMGDRNFTPIRKDSVEASKDFNNESCDVVFIDMEHTYEAVKKDIEAWLPKVKTGGYIAGHDYDSIHPGLVKAVEEAFLKDKIITMGRCWLYKKQPSAWLL